MDRRAARTAVRQRLPGQPRRGPGAARRRRPVRAGPPQPRQPGRRRAPGRLRSEEHTSELQSLMRTSYAVLCLKKKKTKIQHDKQKKIYEQVNTHKQSQKKQANTVDYKKKRQKDDMHETITNILHK